MKALFNTALLSLIFTTSLLGGTWGTKTFENDGGLDWLYDLEQSNDLSVLKDSLVPEDLDYLDVIDAEMILCASEVILGIESTPRKDLPKSAKKWIKNHKDLDVSLLIPKAISLCERILKKDSELLELWQENEELYPKWRENVEDLIERLKSEPVGGHNSGSSAASIVTP